MFPRSTQGGLARERRLINDPPPGDIYKTHVGGWTPGPLGPWAPGLLGPWAMRESSSDTIQHNNDGMGAKTCVPKATQLRSSYRRTVLNTKAERAQSAHPIMNRSIHAASEHSPKNKFVKLISRFSRTLITGHF